MTVDGTRCAAARSTAGRAATAYLDDYAFLAAGLLDLYEATFDPRWLRAALGLERGRRRALPRSPAGGYFLTADDAEALLAREKPAYDGAEPSRQCGRCCSTSAAPARAHRRRPLPRPRRGGAARLRAGDRRRCPTAMPRLLERLDSGSTGRRRSSSSRRTTRAEAEPFLAVLRHAASCPTAFWSAVAEPDRDALADAGAAGGRQGGARRRATAYVCERGVCALPTTDPAVFAHQIDGTSSPQSHRAPGRKSRDR